MIFIAKAYNIFKLVAAVLLALGFQHAGAQSQTDTVVLGSSKVLLAQRCAEPIAGVLFVHVHEDEATAVEAMTAFQQQTGLGCFITLQHGGGRNISFSLQGKSYKFDANRIYTDAGRTATLSRLSTATPEALQEVKKLSDALTCNYIDPNKLIVALHNNTDLGGLTIKTYQKGGAYANDASKVYVNKKQDVDDFFYTTSERAFNYFKSKGFNVLLQNNATVTDDGSLSVYAGIKGMDYINIEAQHGSKAQQVKMLHAVLSYIQAFYSASNHTGFQSSHPAE